MGMASWTLTSPHDGCTLNAIAGIQGQVAVQVIQLSKVVAVIVMEAPGLEQSCCCGVLQPRGGGQTCMYRL